MALANVITSQTGARQVNAPDFTKYSQFVGGVNATHHALMNYSPQMNGFGRLFMVRVPHVIAKMFAGGDDLYNTDSLFTQFKHMLEYMNRSVTGFGDTELQNAATAIQGGFAGRQFNTPTIMRDTTQNITISLYEMNGSLVHTVVTDWMRAIGDPNSGLAHYGGWIGGGAGEDNIEKRLFARDGESENGIAFNEAMHTCEFIYILHDRSGAQVERALLLSDCYPTNINSSAALNMGEGGTHDNITYEVQFNCVVYQSAIINAIANDLLKQYRIVSNSLNFNPELGDAVYGQGTDQLFAKSLGSVPVDSATGTNIGNVPVFTTTNAPLTRIIGNKSMTDGKLAGQPGRTIQENWDGFAQNQ